MKKLFFAFIAAFMLASCADKNLIVSGKITGASPLDRIEIIKFSDPATLPIANFGVDKNGNFSDTITVPKDGVYIITYRGMSGYIYLKRGAHFKIDGQTGVFPFNFKISDNAKNNIFLQQSQGALQDYFKQIKPTIIAEKEAVFLAKLQKYKNDLYQATDSIAHATGASEDILKWKKGQIDIMLLTFTNRYDAQHGRVVNQPDYKVSKNFKAFEKQLIGDEHYKIATFPKFRQYLLSGLGEEFQKFATAHKVSGELFTQTFIRFMKDKDFDATTRDYLISFIAGSVDLRPNADDTKIRTLLDQHIQNSAVQKSMHELELAVFGKPINTPAPNGKLLNTKGESVKLSQFYQDKPSLLIFYTSWAPNIGNYFPNQVKNIAKNYKDKLNLVFINLDDNFSQFKKTNEALLNGIEGAKLYAKGGLNATLVKEFGIYGFKIPATVIISPEGNIASKTFRGLNEFQFKQALGKATGISNIGLDNVSKQDLQKALEKAKSNHDQTK